MMCTSGPPCMPGNTTLSMAAANSCLRENHARTRAAQSLVRRGGDNVRVRHRRRMRAARDQSGKVRHVHEVKRADLVGNLAHAREVNDARIRAAAADDQFGALFLGQLFQLVVVDGFGFFA